MDKKITIIGGGSSNFCPSTEDIEKLMNDLFEAHREYLPQFA